MSKIKKVEFQQLHLFGDNYLTWCIDAKLHLTSYELEKTIIKDNEESSVNKAKALCFLRHHMMEEMKIEYLTVRDPLVLWDKLQVRYGHQKDVILPKARYEWHKLRFQDYKSVAEYNSAVHRIVSTRTLCGDIVTESDMLEKTMSTLHMSNIVLKRHYRNHKFQTHADLITVLLVAEQNDDLVMKNHELRPPGSKPAPEVHAISVHGRGRGRGGGRGRGQGRRSYDGHKQNQKFLKVQGRGVNKNPQGGKKKKQPTRDGHCSRSCQEEHNGGSYKSKGKLEANHAHIDDPKFATSDFFGDASEMQTVQETEFAP